MKKEVTVQIPGKVNFHLEVAGRRADGYHRIASLFQTVSLFDQLRLRSLTDASRIELSGRFSCPPERNTITRAAALFFSSTGIAAGVRIEAEKNIPEGSGLGGGSADAAGTLLALNELHGRPLRESRLTKLGEKIGSDVPFFLSASAAVVCGRGEKVRPVVPRTGYPILLAIPPFSVSTVDAYHWIDEDGLQAENLRTGRKIAAMYEEVDPGEWTFTNTFESVLFPRFPQLKEVLESMKTCGALFSGVTGSGSAVFSLFPDTAARERAKKQLSGGVFSLREVEMLARKMTVVLQ